MNGKSCPIWQIISFILPPNEYGCVYAWTTLGNIVTFRFTILAKKIVFSDKAHCDLGGYVNNQNCCIWCTANPHAYMEKPTHLKTCHCCVQILIQIHNWSSQWRSLSGHVEWIFVHKNWREEYWQHLVSTGRRYVPHSRSYTLCFAPCFWSSHCQPQSWCCLANLQLRFDIVGLLFVGCLQR